MSPSASRQVDGVIIVRILNRTALPFTILVLILSAIACDTGSGLFGTGDTIEDEDAYALILFAYGQLNRYAIYGPGTYDGGTVTVSDDYNADIINALYTNNVTCVFEGFASGSTTMSGTGLVEAYMDSYDGEIGAKYSGTFKGLFGDAEYTLKMNYTSKNSAGSGISSEGYFTVNGKRYNVDADQDMIYSFF